MTIRTIDRAISQGRLKAVRFGGRVLVHKAEVERFEGYLRREEVRHRPDEERATTGRSEVTVIDAEEGE